MDVVESDLPLLLSKKAMKKAQMKIDLAGDTVTAFGNKEKSITTSVDLLNLTDQEQFKAVEKLHLHQQFGQFERDGKWKGPAKVIFQDGKVIWVRHGSFAMRVSAIRIVKQGEGLYDDDLIKTQYQKRVDQVNEDKEIGNKVVQAEDTDTEDITEGALEGSESIDNNLEETDEEFNQFIDNEAISKEREEIDNES